MKIQQLDYLKLKIKNLLLVFLSPKKLTHDMYISLYVQMAIVVFLELKLIVFSNSFRVMNIKKCNFLKTETNGVSRYEN